MSCTLPALTPETRRSTNDAPTGEACSLTWISDSLSVEHRPRRRGKLVALPRISGLDHRYIRKAA